MDHKFDCMDETPFVILGSRLHKEACTPPQSGLYLLTAQNALQAVVVFTPNIFDGTLVFYVCKEEATTLWRNSYHADGAPRVSCIDFDAVQLLCLVPKANGNCHS